MNPIIRQYHHWVEWSDEDECFLGRCPDLFGGGCYGDDPVQVYRQLLELMDEVAADYLEAQKALPRRRIYPSELAA